MALSFRPVEPDDARRVHALHEATTPQEGGRPWETWWERWRWCHLDNPWRREGVPVGIVAESGDRLVGHLGLVPVPLWRGQDDFVGQASEGFLVDPDAQGQGIGRQLAERAWGPGALPMPVTFTANSTSTHLFEKFGAVRAPLALSQPRLGILDAGAFTARLRAGGGAVGRVLRIPGVAAAVRTTGSGLLRALWWARRARTGLPVVTLNTSADRAEIDSVANSTRDPRVLSVATDARYLEWRYEATPAADRENVALLGFRDGNRRLRAVAVVEARTHPDWGGTFATLMELVTPRTERSADLLAHLIHHGRAQGWVALRTPFLSPAWDHACRSFGFLREQPRPIYTVVKPVGPLADAGSWAGDLGAWSLGFGCRW